jgi:putative transposase
MNRLAFDGQNTNTSNKEVLKELLQNMLETMMEAERTDHLGYPKGKTSQDGLVRDNHRNGYYPREYLSELGLMTDLKIPRDRLSEFLPKLLGFLERRSPMVNDLALSLYKKGMSQRDIVDVIDEIYDKKLSPMTISTLAKAVTAEREAWEKRKLSKRYMFVFVDAIHVNVRRAGTVENDAIYIVYGITQQGQREVLGMYSGATESATSWEGHLVDLKKRGVDEVLMFIMDGLTELTATVKKIFPKTLTQRCVVHQIRQTLSNVRIKHKAEIVEDLKTIYQSTTFNEAQNSLNKIKLKWRSIYPRLFNTWENYLPEFMAFLHFPKEIHRYIYTTNWLERLNKEIRKVIKTKNSYPTEESVKNVIFSKLMELQTKWGERRLPNFDKVRLEINKLWDERYPQPSGAVTQSY